MDADARRSELYKLCGELPARDRPVHAETLSQAEEHGYLLERLALDLNGVESVPACFARPVDTTGPLPTVLYSHAHGGDYALGTTRSERTS